MRLNILLTHRSRRHKQFKQKVTLQFFFSFRNTKSCKLFQAFYGQFVVNFDMEANNPQREALKICTNNDVCVHKKRTIGYYVICSAVSFQCFKSLLFSPGIFRRVFLLFDFVMFVLLLHYCAIISGQTYLVCLFSSHTCSPCIQMYTDSSTMARWGHMYQSSYKDLEYIGLLKEKTTCVA